MRFNRKRTAEIAGMGSAFALGIVLMTGNAGAQTPPDPTPAPAPAQSTMPMPTATTPATGTPATVDPNAVAPVAPTQSMPTMIPASTYDGRPIDALANNPNGSNWLAKFARAGSSGPTDKSSMQPQMPHDASMKSHTKPTMKHR